MPNSRNSRLPGIPQNNHSTNFHKTQSKTSVMEQRYWNRTLSWITHVNHSQFTSSKLSTSNLLLQQSMEWLKSCALELFLQLNIYLKSAPIFCIDPCYTLECIQKYWSKSKSKTDVYYSSQCQINIDKIAFFWESASFYRR